jgi:hypothetical protein
MGVSKLKVPKTLGGYPDLLKQVQEHRYELQRQVKALKSFETELKNQFVRVLPKGTTGVDGKAYHLGTAQTVIPIAEDWEKIEAWILKKSKDFAVLQRRLGQGHIEDLWKAKVKVPGVGEFKDIAFSLTKL